MIDTHCHINDELYINNPEQYISDAREAGVKKFLVVGFDLKSSENAVKITQKHDFLFVAVGIHPSDVKKANKEDFVRIDELANDKKVVAIGEIGLDYYWDKDPQIKEEQKIAFIKQIEIANKHNLPISIHCRDAIEDTLEILKKYPVKRGGIMHCYAGSVESAKDFIKLGFLLGIGGVVTFKNSQKLKEVVANIPSDSYVLETDAPYLTPEPFRGKPNHSKYLCYVRDKIAELRKISANKVEEETTKNFERVFLKWRKFWMELS